MWPIFHIAVGLLKKKLRDRVHVHYSLEEFHNFIDPDILPHKIGGNLEESEAFDLDLVDKILRENVIFKGNVSLRRIDDILS